MGTVSCLLWSFEFRSYAGLRTLFRTFGTGFTCGSVIVYYISNRTLEVAKGVFYFSVTPHLLHIHAVI
jgi:hypothetical protein